MLLEVAKPVALLLCLLSLYALFHTAFLALGTTPDLFPGSMLYDKLLDALPLSALSAAICIVSGLLFRETESEPRRGLSTTLPLQIFYWATGTMLALFILSWYLETHCIFYRSILW